MEDLKVSRDQAFSMIEEHDSIQYRVLNYMTAGINYGGRVTDQFDNKFITTFSKLFINEQIAEENTDKP